ncbi:hypothetical protein [Streptomyces sp. NPDC056401]|uniref:hypothetical protein n=1 Tax=Streptomyces sp. NPDC056401 TaxID=3345809 RepID=UPI0035D52CEB
MQAVNRPAPARGGTVVSDPATLLGLEALDPIGTVRLAYLADWKVDSLTASTDSVYARSTASGTGSTHPTTEAALNWLTGQWLNTDTGGLMTASGTVHATRTEMAERQDRRAQTVALRSAQPVE